MAKNTQLTNLVVNAQADAITALLTNGTCKIYDGTQPATADTALSANNLLATLTFQATAAPAAAAGVITFNALTAGTAGATGTATFFRCFKADGTTVVFDGSIGTATANMILGTVSIVSGASVTSTSFTHTVAKSASGF